MMIEMSSPPPMVAPLPDGYARHSQDGTPPPPTPPINLCPEDLDFVCTDKVLQVTFSRPRNWSMTRGKTYKCDYPTDLIPGIFPRGAFIDQGDGTSCMKEWVTVSRNDFDIAYDFLSEDQNPDVVIDLPEPIDNTAVDSTTEQKVASQPQPNVDLGASASSGDDNSDNSAEGGTGIDIPVTGGTPNSAPATETPWLTYGIGAALLVVGVKVRKPMMQWFVGGTPRPEKKAKATGQSQQKQETTIADQSQEKALPPYIPTIMTPKMVADARRDYLKAQVTVNALYYNNGLNQRTTLPPNAIVVADPADDKPAAPVEAVKVPIFLQDRPRTRLTVESTGPTELFDPTTKLLLSMQGTGSAEYRESETQRTRREMGLSADPIPYQPKDLSEQIEDSLRDSF